MPTAGQLGSSVLRVLRCAELRLPVLPDGAPEEAWAAVQAGVEALLASPGFLRSSGGCLASLHGVPLAAAAKGTLAFFSRLRHLQLVDRCWQLASWHRTAGMAPACVPPSLRSLALPAAGLAAGLAVPASVQRLQPYSSTFLAVTAEVLAACPCVSARAGRTVTLLLDALGVPGGRCRQLALEARYVVFSSPQPAHCAALAALSRAAAPPTLAGALRAWLGILAPVLAAAGMQRLGITACDVTLYCRSTGSMAVLQPARWRQPGSVAVRAHGFAAQLCWPAPACPPAFFRLEISQEPGCCPEE